MRRQYGVSVAYVIDRDYRPRTAADATYTDRKRGFMWRRHAIESYLLEPAVIVETFRRLKASVATVPGGGPRWARALPEDVALVAEGLRACASARAPAEALRIAVQRLWEDLSETAGRIQRRVPDVASGGVSPDAVSCRRAFHDEAERLVRKAQETAASPHLTLASIGRRYDEALAEVNATAYTTELRFIEDFHGKDVLGALLIWLQQECGSSLKRERFITELEQAVPVVYGANRSLYRTDDFLDLANGVLALAGSPPL